MFLGTRLKDLRNKKGLTQSELGKMLNVTKVSICCYEKNVRIPSLDTLEDLARFFNVSVEYFLGMDIPVVMEDSPEYTYYIRKEELDFIKQLRSFPNVYNKITSDPKRMVELIGKKLK